MYVYIVLISFIVLGKSTKLRLLSARTMKVDGIMVYGLVEVDLGGRNPYSISKNKIFFGRAYAWELWSEGVVKYSNRYLAIKSSLVHT